MDRVIMGEEATEMGPGLMANPEKGPPFSILDPTLLANVRCGCGRWVPVTDDVGPVVCGCGRTAALVIARKP